jgi:hypothetical protein
MADGQFVAVNNVTGICIELFRIKALHLGLALLLDDFGSELNVECLLVSRIGALQHGIGRVVSGSGQDMCKGKIVLKDDPRPIAVGGDVVPLPTSSEGGFGSSFLLQEISKTLRDSVNKINFFMDFKFGFNITPIRIDVMLRYKMELFFILELCSILRERDVRCVKKN